MTPSQAAALLARLHAETYAAWVERFCRERGIPWRPEYAFPIDDEPKRKGP